MTCNGEAEVERARTNVPIHPHSCASSCERLKSTYISMQCFEKTSLCATIRNPVTIIFFIIYILDIALNLYLCILIALFQFSSFLLLRFPNDCQKCTDHLGETVSES